MSEKLFGKILYAYDGSEVAVEAFNLALAIAKQTGGELHVVSVGRVDYVPQLIGEIVEQEAAAARRLQSFLFRVQPLAIDSEVELHGHALIGQPVRVIVALALQLNADLLVIGARVRSAIHERLLGSRPAQIMRLAHCPVLVIKVSDRQRRTKNRAKFARILEFGRADQGRFAGLIDSIG